MVPAPEKHRPTQPVEEVLRGLVRESTSHERQGPFPGAELCRQLTASCLPSSPAQRASRLPRSAASRLPSIPIRRASRVFPAPPGSSATLCCISVTETFLAFPFRFTPKSPFTPVSPLVLIGPLCKTGILL